MMALKKKKVEKGEGEPDPIVPPVIEPIVSPTPPIEDPPKPDIKEDPKPEIIDIKKQIEEGIAKKLKELNIQLPESALDRYAEKLKTELGDYYIEDFDKLPLENRIETMELSLKSIENTKATQVGTSTPPNEPILSKEVKTLYQQQEDGKFTGKNSELANKLLKARGR